MIRDAKMRSIEMIYHRERTATKGDVRLNPTPRHWHPAPVFKERNVNCEINTIEAYLH